VLPGVKNTPQSTKIAGDDGTISVIVTKRVLGKEERLHPRQQDSRPLPKTPPDIPCIFFCVVRSIARDPKNIDNFALTARNRLVNRIIPFLLPHCPANGRQCLQR
jgi:hypothetical protein